MIVSIAATHAAEDTLYRYAVWGSDPDSALWGDRVHYHLTIRPSWVTIDTVLGVISGTPHAINVGDTVVTVQASDGKGGIATQSYPLHVSHTNHAPVIKTVSLPSAIEDSLYQTRVYASDQDSALFGDVVHYRLLKPAWLVIDSTAGVISGTPHVQNVFDTVAVLQAYDNHGATTQQQYTIHITLVNHPPAIASSPVLTAHEDTLYQYQFVAHDPDTLIGQILSYALTQKPIWLNISASGMVSGIPRGVNVGDSTVAIMVSDGHGGTATQSYSLTVTHTNHAPVVKTASLPSAIEDTLYQSRVYASDQDSALFGDVVHYRLLKPAWLVIDSATGIISGTPHVQNVFDTVAVLQAFDNRGGTAQQQYTIHVALVNHPPTIASSPLFIAHEDTLYQYQVVAHDPDTLIGQVLSYALTQKPGWLSVSASGMVSGIPRGANVGDSTVTIKVSDGYGGVVNQTYRLNVIHTNHNPYFVSVPDSVDNGRFVVSLHGCGKRSGQCIVWG